MAEWEYVDSDWQTATVVAAGALANSPAATTHGTQNSISCQGCDAVELAATSHTFGTETTIDIYVVDVDRTATPVETYRSYIGGAPLKLQIHSTDTVGQPSFPDVAPKGDMIIYCGSTGTAGNGAVTVKYKRKRRVSYT